MTDASIASLNKPYIAKIQRSLNEILYSNLVEDGEFGSQTVKVLQDWQLAHGYEPTGKYENETQRVLDKYIDIRFLKEQDFVDASKVLSCPITHVKAVTKIESKGEGFLLSGRNVILFERHIFYSQLNKILRNKPELVKSLAQQFKLKDESFASLQQHLIVNYPNIYNPKTGGYKGTVNGVEYEWERFQQAFSINAQAAALSASYGLFQIMGFNYHLIAGYTSAEDMVDAFAESEKNQLMAFCKFIQASSGLLKAIRNGDWLTFAILYNGPSQKGYDKKLASAVKSFETA